MTPQAVLAINAGSSSLKFALFELRGDGDPQEIFRDQVEGNGAAGLHAVLGRVDDRLGGVGLVAAGHRVVHGGTRFVVPLRVDAGVLEALEALTPLAPLHQPHNLAPIRALATARPNLQQVVCFDTAFHAAMPDEATRLALPRAISESGVRRYGFHGLSYEFIAHRLRTLAPALANGRALVAHLGNGASLCAMRAGRSVDTTMSFTALDGLVMGSRPGTLDPGAVLYLIREGGMTAEQVEDMLYHRAGLLGVSGISGDMRTLLGSADPHAREAVALFVARFAREAGGLISVLGGIDGIVFTGGIGEHAAPVRADASARLAWLGLRLDPAANANGVGRVSAPDSAVEAWVIPTDEEAMIARHTVEVLGLR